MNLMVETTFRWVSMTPCGCPVLPDVYWRNARSSASGSAYAGAAASASRSDGSRTARTPGACAADSSTPLRNQPIVATARSEEHTSELQSRLHLVCRLLLEKKK